MANSIVIARVADIAVRDRLRAIDETAVALLAESIALLGLQTPILVAERDDELHLVDGAHRLTAAHRLGHDEIEVRLVADPDPQTCRLLEISANLARSELSVQERADHVALWVRLVCEKRGQIDQVFRSGGRGREGGVALAARDLGMPRSEVSRSLRIASLSCDVRRAADGAGLTTQTARLAIATAPDPLGKIAELSLKKERSGEQPPGGQFTPEQIAARPDLHEIVGLAGGLEKLNKELALENAELDAIIAAWNRAGPVAQEFFAEKLCTHVDWSFPFHIRPFYVLD